MAENTGYGEATSSSSSSNQNLLPAHKKEVLPGNADGSPLIISITALQREHLQLIDFHKYVKEKFSSDVNAYFSKQNGDDIINIFGNETSAENAKCWILHLIQGIIHIKLKSTAPVSLFKKKVILQNLRNELGKIPCSLMVATDIDVYVSSWTIEDCAKGEKSLADLLTIESIPVTEDIAYLVCDPIWDERCQKINVNQKYPWIIEPDKQGNSIILHGIKSYNLKNVAKWIKDSVIKTQIAILLSANEFNYFSKFRIEKIFSMCEEHSVQAMFLQSDKNFLFLKGTSHRIASVQRELERITSALIVSDSLSENEAYGLIPSLLQLQEHECVDDMVREVSHKCDCFIDVVAKEPIYSPVILLCSELSAVQSVEMFGGLQLTCGECVSCIDPGKEIMILLTSENADGGNGKSTAVDALYSGWATSNNGKRSFIINMVVMGIRASEMQKKNTVMFFVRSIPDFYMSSLDELATDILKTLQMYSKWTHSTHLKSVGMYSDNATLIQTLTGYLPADELMSKPPTSLVFRRDFDTGMSEPTAKTKTVVFISDSEEKIKHAKELLRSCVDELLSRATATVNENVRSRHQSLSDVTAAVNQNVGLAASGENEDMESSAKLPSQHPHGNVETPPEACAHSASNNEGYNNYFDEPSEERQNHNDRRRQDASGLQNQQLSESFTEDDGIVIRSGDLKPEKNDALCTQLGLRPQTLSINIKGVYNISTASLITRSVESKDYKKENYKLPAAQRRTDDGINAAEAMDVDDDQITKLWSHPVVPVLQMIDHGCERAEHSAVVQLNREAEVRHQRTAGPTDEAGLGAATRARDDPQKDGIQHRQNDDIGGATWTRDDHQKDGIQHRQNDDIGGATWTLDDHQKDGIQHRQNDDIGGATWTRDDERQRGMNPGKHIQRREDGGSDDADRVQTAADDIFHDAIDRVDIVTSTTEDKYEAGYVNATQDASMMTENILEEHHFEERCIIINKFNSKDVTAEFLRSLFSAQLDAVVIPFQYGDHGLLVFSAMKDAKNALRNMCNNKNFKLEAFPHQNLVNVSADLHPDVVEACKNNGTLDDFIWDLELRTGINVKQHAHSDRITLFGTFLQITIASNILTNRNRVMSNRPRDDNLLSGSSAKSSSESYSNMVTKTDGAPAIGVSGMKEGHQLSPKVNTGGRNDDKMHSRAVGNSKKKAQDEFLTTKFSKYGIKLTQKLFEDDFEKMRKSTKLKLGSVKNGMYEITYLREKEEEVKGFLEGCVKIVENPSSKKSILITGKDKNKVKSLKSKMKQMPGVYMSKSSNEVSLISFDQHLLTNAYEVAFQHLGRNKNANTNSGKRDQAPQVWCSYTNQGIRVLVYNGNIIKLSVEAIVNATDFDFNHGSGVSRVIMDAAGWKVEKECRTWSQHNGQLTVGCYIATSAGNLPCKHIIHVHGPRWDDFPDKTVCRDMLRQTIQNALFYCCNNNVKSIAFPAISSGTFGVPKDVCANAYRLAVNTIKWSTPVCLEEIHFVDIKDDILDAIKKEFDELKEPENFDTRDENQVQGNANTSGTSDRECQAIAASEQMVTPLKYTDNSALSEKNPERHLMMNGNNPDGSSVDPFPRWLILSYPEDLGIGFSSTVYHLSKSFEITVSTGDILRLKNMGVILSPEDAKCSGLNPFPAMLLSRGDYTYRSIHNDTQKMASGSMRVVATNSGNLPFIKVIHVCHGSVTQAAQHIEYRNVLMEAFLKAESLQLSGVAMPVMGTDEPGGNLNDVLHEFITTIKEFHVTRSTCKVKQFHIVSRDSSLSNLVNQCCDDILMSSSFARSNSQNASDKDSMNPEIETCHICLDVLKQPKTLEKCKHTFCSDCIDQVKVKSCPVCRTPFGMITGNQPHGTMKISNDKYYPCFEYSAYGTIEIVYNFPSGIQTDEHPNPGKPYSGTSRTAYLPNNREGQRLLKLLRLAFDRRLTFTVGTSSTTGQNDCVTWNDIHHKTSRSGGPDNFGYPDPTYFTRLSEELAAKGITDASLSSDVTTDPMMVTQHNAAAQPTRPTYNTRAHSATATQPLSVSAYNLGLRSVTRSQSSSSTHYGKYGRNTNV